MWKLPLNHAQSPDLRSGSHQQPCVAPLHVFTHGVIITFTQIINKRHCASARHVSMKSHQGVVQHQTVQVDALDCGPMGLFQFHVVQVVET